LPNNEDFFADQSEQSFVKARIVASYFSAWSRIIQKWNVPMAYIDLYCGPGKYGDNNLAAPLLIIEHTLTDPLLLNKMHFLFNDKDTANIDALKNAISQMDTDGKLGKNLKYYSETVEDGFHSRLNIPTNVPVLSFVDPFGYKGLTMDLINKLISNKGSDCIFFFNYNRINMALSSNSKFDEHLKNLFGEERTYRLKEQLADLSAKQREPIILKALIEALCENKSNYVLPFKFYSTEMLRTSHFIIFVTKHPTACKIMKQIMYSNSAKDADGVATFSFEDSRNFGNDYEQIGFFNRPIETLKEIILHRYSGHLIQVGQLCEAIECDFSNHFVAKNVKDVLRKIESEGKLYVISGRKQKFRNGKLNMPDKAIVQIV